MRIIDQLRAHYGGHWTYDGQMNRWVQGERFVQAWAVLVDEDSYTTRYLWNNGEPAQVYHYPKDKNCASDNGEKGR